MNYVPTSVKAEEWEISQRRVAIKKKLRSCNLKWYLYKETGESIYG